MTLPDCSLPLLRRRRALPDQRKSAGLDALVVLTKPDGAHLEFRCTHTFSPEQLEWFKAGSALNVIRQQQAHAAHGILG